MKRTPIAVTGLGLICALGKSVDEAFDNTKNGVSGVKKTISVDTAGCYADLAAEIPDFKSENADSDRAVELALHAAQEAVSDAKLDNIGEKTAVIFGSCVGGVRSGEDYYGGSPTRENALKMPIAPIAVKIAEEFGAKGFVTNVANACAAGTMSISLACDLIEEGRQDAAIVGGSDAFSSVPFAGFLALHALDEKGCSPFNRSEGITLGEGAGALVLESYERAKKRGAKIYCFVSGSGVTADAYDLTAPRPDGEGQIQAIKAALRDARLAPSDVDYVNAHGTGTKKNDEAELLSLRKIFEEKTVDVSSTKSMTGHCLGAAGAIEAVFCVKSLENGVILPTIGFDGDKEEIQSGVNVVKNKAKNKRLFAAMNNSFAFGGTNASVIFAKSGEQQEKTSSDKNADIVITGIGLKTAFAKNTDEFLEFINKSETLKTRENHVVVANDELLAVGVKMPFYRKMDNLSKSVTFAGITCLKDAKYDVSKGNEFDTGIIVGTALGALGTGCEFQKNIAEKGVKAGSAFKFPNTVYNAAGGHLSICSGIKGYNATVTNGAQSGLECIAIAMTEIRKSRINSAVCVGADDITDEIGVMYEKIGLFNRSVTLFDGAAAVFLEDGEAARKRGAKAYCSVLGYGKSHNGTPYGEFCHNIDGLSNAINAAISDAAITADEIGEVIIDGSVGDFEETEAAIKSKFGEASLVRIGGNNAYGCAAGAALCAALGAARLSGREDKKSEAVSAKRVEKTMILSRATGGSYCALVLGKYKGKEE